ncbi:MAG: B12-binding domain-containing radical SAM protein [Myxococcales bacterium]|nr:B12-binding domain-containing radical SAM protein [Myxococcales bacterium]
MKVTVVHPPTLLNVRNLGTMKPSLPLGLAYVAAAAREAGHLVRVVDAIALAPHETARDRDLLRIGAGPAEIAAAVPEDTEVLAIGCTFSFLWPLVRELVVALRARFPRAFIVAGGEHLSALPERSLREAPLDLVAIGEGEETFVCVLAALERGARRCDDIAGVAFLRDGAYHATPRRARLRDIDRIAPPAWDLFDVASYNAHDFSLGMRLGFSLPILATRGCPYSCTFCTSPDMWTTRWQARSPRLVVDEMASYVDRYGARSFPFHDLTAVVKRRFIVELCQEILARKLDVTWQLPAGTRCEAFDAEVAELMVRAGCRYLAFAPESGSPEVRERLKKRFTEDTLYEAVRVAVPAGMHVSCYFIVGLPFDTRAGLGQTLAMVRRLAQLGVEDISAHYFHPAPGSELYRELDARGKLRHDDEELMSALHMTGLTPPKDGQGSYCDALTPLELAFWRYLIFATFYATRFAARPTAALHLVTNVLAERETNKLEAFARELKLKLSWRRRGAAARAAAARVSP